MKYQLYTTKTYMGIWKLSLVINGNYFTDIDRLSHYLRMIDLINDKNEFKKIVKTLNFSTEDKMNQAKDYLDALLIFGKLIS